MIKTQRRMRSLVTLGAALTLGTAGVQHGLTTDTASAAAAKPVTVKVTLRDYRVAMSRHTLPAGTPIRFVITNRGKAMHETVLERAGADDDALEVRGKKFEADDIAPGTTRIVTWTVLRPGTYQLACHMPGHFEMGMKTSFTVRRGS
jgi:uncharacterized cupredoxin-like copper-binding protein